MYTQGAGKALAALLILLAFLPAPSAWALRSVALLGAGDGPGAAVLAGRLREAAWPAGEERSFDAEIAVSPAAPRGSDAGLHLLVRGDGFAQDLPVPVVLHGP